MTSNTPTKAKRNTTVSPAAGDSRDTEVMTVITELASFMHREFGWGGQHTAVYIGQALGDVTAGEHGKQAVLDQLSVARQLAESQKLLIVKIGEAVLTNYQTAVDNPEEQPFLMEDQVWLEAVEALRTPAGWLFAKLIYAMGVPRRLVEAMNHEAEIMP